MHNDVPAGLVDVVQMDKHSIKLEERLRKRDGELQKSQGELQVASGTILDTQHPAMRKTEEARSSPDQ